MIIIVANTGENIRVGNQLQDLVDEAKLELQQNLEQFQKMKKKPVVFGTPIQLLHVKSRKFLSFKLGGKDSSMLTSDQYRYPSIMLMS